MVVRRVGWWVVVGVLKTWWYFPIFFWGFGLLACFGVSFDSFPMFCGYLERDYASCRRVEEVPVSGRCSRVVEVVDCGL